MTLKAGPQPRGRVAKALTGIFAPAAGPVTAVAGPQSVFSPFGGPAELARDAGGDLRFEQRLPGAAARVAQPHPHEVEDFVDKDTGPFGRLAAQRRIQHQPPLARVAGGMNGLARTGTGFQPRFVRAQAPPPFHVNRFAAQARQRGRQALQGFAGPCKKLSSFTSTVAEARTLSTHLSRNSFCNSM
jgi:hypothetical protein